jgi:hypothetical protein
VERLGGKEKDDIMLMGGGGPFVPAPFKTLGQFNVFPKEQVTTQKKEHKMISIKL